MSEHVFVSNLKKSFQDFGLNPQEIFITDFEAESSGTRLQLWDVSSQIGYIAKGKVRKNGQFLIECLEYASA